MRNVRRIQKELKELKIKGCQCSSPDQGGDEARPDVVQRCACITARPVDDDDIYLWNASVRGPTGTPYEGGCFHLAVRFPQEYPFRPPHLRFITPIYHPNVDENGEMSLDLTFHSWSPAITLHQVLLHLVAVLEVPNPDNCLRPELGQLHRTNRAAFEDNAREATRLYAS
jgi:ubiquitin-conjugating enzyme E2 D/E